VKPIELITNRRIRNSIILGMLLIVLCWALYKQLFPGTKPEQGAIRVVKCTDEECKHSAVKKIMDIGNKHDPNCVCEKCGKPVGYSFKCEDCDYEFAYIPVEVPPPKELKKLKTMGKFQFAQDLQKCPNCGSTRTYPMPVDSQ